MFARMMEGGRASLAVGTAAMLLSLAIGGLVGILAGFVRWLDGVLMRLTDLFLALPSPSSRTGDHSPVSRHPADHVRTGSRHLHDGCRRDRHHELDADRTCRQGRGTHTERTRLRDRGALRWHGRRGALSAVTSCRIVLSPLTVSATLGIANAIITESALSFLGLGFPSDFATWGRLLFDATDYLQQYPGRVIWPGLAISLTVLSVNYLGDGLRDSLDPRVNPGEGGEGRDQQSKRRCIGCEPAGQNPTMSPPLRPSMSRASAGLATSRERSSMMRRILAT